MISNIIAQSQAGNNEATMKLIEKFNPLLKKYAYKLHYDDAYNDLILDFIELIYNIKLDCVNNKSEGCLVSYISKSMHSSYIKKSIASNKLNYFVAASDLSENMLYYLEASSASYDTYFQYELPGIDRILTKSEKSVIQMIFLTGYSVSETAQRFGTSRQAVNQMKNRALEKLKTQFTDKL